jgi:hypothetical protein
VPYYFLIPYIITFVFFLFLSIRFSDKTLKFWKNKNGDIFAGYGWHALAYYLMATSSRVMLLTIVTAFRLDVSSALNVNLAGMTYPIFNALSMLALIAIFLDFLLLSGKGLMRGLDLRLLRHYSLILSGKEKVRQE